MMPAITSAVRLLALETMGDADLSGIGRTEGRALSWYGMPQEPATRSPVWAISPCRSRAGESPQPVAIVHHSHPCRSPDGGVA
ncbi:unannotated protein [freshwater metagenome]|uniref:Unannotated protein n=1 Tax=freshwater metagenome TaxID=449393 RepID=A0A6J7SH71_9ZZZZ